MKSLLNFKYSDALLKFLERTGNEIPQRHNKVRRWVRKLINVRNHLLKYLKELANDDILRRNSFEHPLEKEDLLVQVKSTEYILNKIKPSR